MNKSTRRGAIGVLCRSNGDFLVIERAASVRAPGRFCFPGGAIETGESEEEAVVREMSEELCLNAKPVEETMGK